MIISVCGKSGSGKSTISNELKNIYRDKIIHVEIDKIGHMALEDDRVKNEIIQSFGEKLLNDQNIDRKKLGYIVFNSRNEMKKLSCITWNYMESVIDIIIDRNKDRIIVLDYLLLPVTKFFKMSDIRILLDVDYEVRKNRCIIRDNISEEEFNLREKASIDYDKNEFDYVISSSENVRELVKIYE